MGMNLRYITANGHFDRSKISDFLSLKLIAITIKSFVVLMYQNNLATTTALTGKRFVPELQKINMCIIKGIKVRGLVAEAPKLFSAPL